MSAGPDSKPAGGNGNAPVDLSGLWTPMSVCFLGLRSLLLNFYNNANDKNEMGWVIVLMIKNRWQGMRSSAGTRILSGFMLCDPLGYSTEHSIEYLAIEDLRLLVQCERLHRSNAPMD